MVKHKKLIILNPERDKYNRQYKKTFWTNNFLTCNPKLITSKENNLRSEK
jgi:hypothetical protein